MRFDWLTENPYMRSREASILEALDLDGGSVLEVGCGQGNNLVVRGVRGAVGIDIDRASLRCAATRTDGRFAQADAARLPFRDGAFDRVFARDILHHVDEARPVVAEMVRVCRPGGKVCVLDDNGRNGILRLFAAIDPCERKIAKQTPENVAALFEGLPVDPVILSVREPTLVYRALLHHKFGLPSLGKSRLFALTMDRVIAALQKTSNPDTWAKISLTATRKPA
ncbi:MAG: methyltransferase domain-containing protein [Planctomycetes bacterium]|nr:methyltransferase domain-containing protein [Planctomycetota bacterium]